MHGNGICHGNGVPIGVDFLILGFQWEWEWNRDMGMGMAVFTKHRK